MSKLTQVLLTMVLVISLLAGCGSSDTSESGTSETDNSGSTDSTAVTADGGELVIWMPPFSGNEDITDQDFWTEHLEPLVEETGAEISIEIVPWDSYETKYLTGISSGEGPDIGYMYMEMFSDYINMGAFADIDGYFSDAEKENYVYYNQGNFGGTQYALPIVVGNPRIFVANMDILNAAGIEEIPRTLEELVTASEAIMAYDDSIIPFQQTWGDSHYGVLNELFWPFYWAYGGTITDESGEPSINNEAGVKAAQYLYDLRYKYAILGESTTATDSGATVPALQDGSLAMAVVSSSKAAILEDDGLNWDYVTYLEGDSGVGGTFVAADSLVLLDNSDNKELAAKAMKLMTSASVMEDFHEQLYSTPPISKDEAYKDLEVFRDLYDNDADHLITLPVFDGAPTLYDTLYKNLQMMMLDDMTPEEVMASTMDYYNSNIKE